MKNSTGTVQVVSEASGFPKGLVVEVCRVVDDHNIFVKSGQVSKSIPVAHVRFINSDGKLI